MCTREKKERFENDYKCEMWTGRNITGVCQQPPIHPPGYKLHHDITHCRHGHVKNIAGFSAEKEIDSITAKFFHKTIDTRLISDKSIIPSVCTIKNNNNKNHDD